MADRFQKIIDLRAVCNEETELIALKTELAAPLLTNLSHIPMIFEWYYEVMDMPDTSPKLNAKRKLELLFVILALYSPMSFIDGKLPNKLRAKLSESFGYKAGSAVSNLCSRDIFFQYQHNDEYRTNVIYICDEVIKRLKEQEIIPLNAIL